METVLKYWEICDVLENAGYTAVEAVTLATNLLFPVACGDDEVDLDVPCPPETASLYGTEVYVKGGA